MTQHIQDFNALIAQASQYLLGELSYAPKTVDRYRQIWKQIRAYMAAHRIVLYDQRVEERLLCHQYGRRSLKEIPYTERTFYHGVKMLTEFSQSGKINLPVRPHKKPILFNGPLGELMTTFMHHKRVEERLSIIRLSCYQRHLSEFLTYCQEHQINTIADVDLRVILLYLGQLNPRTTPVYMAISALRGLLRYAFEQKLLQVDYAKKIPRYKRAHQPKLPSVYAKEEVEKLIASVDRSSPTGKRNYAIILLSARLGLRASDIARLRFEHLHWPTSTISIQQWKTGRDVTLPLLSDVGNAIVDYLRYARPSSEEAQVFLTARPPYGPFPTSNVVTHVVQRAFKKAGISIHGKKFGPHALRHSLASRMLEERTVLPVISEVLGHQSSESTRYYLRIDLKSMQQCILEVPAVASDFYEQKGGMFYE